MCIRDSVYGDLPASRESVQRRIFYTGRESHTFQRAALKGAPSNFERAIGEIDGRQLLTILKGVVFNACDRFGQADAPVRTGGRAVCPVSYTHLDVYKRQAVEPSPADKASDRLRIAESRLLQCPAIYALDDVHMPEGNGTVEHHAAIYGSAEVVSVRADPVHREVPCLSLIHI